MEYHSHQATGPLVVASIDNTSSSPTFSKPLSTVMSDIGNDDFIMSGNLLPLNEKQSAIFTKNQKQIKAVFSKLPCIKTCVSKFEVSNHHSA